MSGTERKPQPTGTARPAVPVLPTLTPCDPLTAVPASKALRRQLPGHEAQPDRSSCTEAER